MSNILAETKRVYLKHWSTDYTRELYSIMSEPKVHTYTSGKAWDKDTVVEYIDFNINREKFSFSNFHAAIVLKKTNELIGFTGLNPYLPNEPEIEWQLGMPYWGKGYATEVGKEVIRLAFENSDIQKIYGMADTENIGSIRVMEKIGMTRLGIRKFRDEDAMFFEIIKSNPV